jgi:hypothetical protein
MSLQESRTIVAENADPTHEDRTDSAPFASNSTREIGTPTLPVARVSREVARVLPLCQTPQSPKALMQQLGLSDRKNFCRRYLRAALDVGVLERTIPDMPHNNQQRYRLSERGKRWLGVTGQ